MPTEMQSLSPQLLGFWVRCIRTTSKWSQDALAEASGLTTRTIQRIEAGQPASVTTRRSLARRLGYENPDVFDDPAFVAEVHKLLERVSDHGEKERGYRKIPENTTQTRALAVVDKKAVDLGDHDAMAGGSTGVIADEVGNPR